MHMKKISSIILFSLLILTGDLQAQEFNIDVKINAPQLKTADPKVFNTLERQIREFFNEQKWTNDEFEPEEKIEGNLQITIKGDPTANSFIADFFIQTIRPVYLSGYNTQILNYVDKDVDFQYEEFQPIQDSRRQFYDNLSSILTFYAYVMLAMDYDSFSPFGGDPYYQIAQEIVLSLPNEYSATSGWSRTRDKSRFVMIDQLLSPKSRAYRESLYNYHRKSLDIIHADPSKARAVMLSSLKSLLNVNRDIPNSMILQMFTDSKRDEIIEIFKVSDRNQQVQVYETMIEIDPAKSSSYNVLKF